MRNFRVIALFVFTAVLCTQSLAAGVKQATISLNIDGDAVGPVNRYVFGNNIVAFTKKYYKGLYRDRGAGVWDPVRHAPVEGFVEAAKQAGTRMLRWPGGKNARYFEWKSAVGPLSSRQRQLFGLPEFLHFCKAVGADPVITLPATIVAKDAADLVEYLEGTVDEKNPNGGVDWARVRVADGQKEPWGTVWFELGNETFYTQMTPEEYVARYRDVQNAIRTISPRVRLGAVLEDSENVDSGWSDRVLRDLGSEIDFAVIHPYVVKLREAQAGEVGKDTVAAATMAADMDLAWRLGLYRDALDRHSPGRTIPLALTEFNGSFVQDKPVPYRHTMLNAIHVADALRLFLDPSYKIAFATFWQFSNSYWGIVRGGLRPDDPIVKQPIQHVFEIYNRYLGEQLLEMKIVGPAAKFSGTLGISPRVGTVALPHEANAHESIPAGWSRRLFLQGKQTEDDGIVRVVFDGESGTDYHHAYKNIEVEPNTLYHVTARVRTVNLRGGKIGIAVQDGRGWRHAFHQPRNTCLTGTNDWTDVTVAYRSLPDGRKIQVLARSFSEEKGPITGTAEFGQVSLRKIRHSFGAVPEVVGVASRGSEGQLYMVLLNKSMSAEIKVTINIVGAKGPLDVGAADVLKARSPYSTNLHGSGREEARVAPINVTNAGNGSFVVSLPPASVAGIRWH